MSAKEDQDNEEIVIMEVQCKEEILSAEEQSNESDESHVPARTKKPKKLIRVKSDSKNFICTFPNCHISYNRSWRLEAHINSVHIKAKPYACTQDGCNRRYICNSHLQRHSKAVHEGLVVACSFIDCGATFTQSSTLKRHCKLVHQKTYECPLCEETFSNARNFANHEKWHEHQAELTCNICLKSWHNMSLLRRHMRSHRVRNCHYPDCAETFLTHLEMRKHLAVKHPPEYFCQYCSKKLLNKSALREHVQQHLDVEERQSFYCSIENCDRVYFHKRNLDYHIRHFHIHQRFYCDQLPCKSSYFTMEKLAAHKRRKHNIASQQSESRKQALISKLTQMCQSEDTEMAQEEKNDVEGKSNVLLVMRRV